MSPEEFCSEHGFRCKIVDEKFKEIETDLKDIRNSMMPKWFFTMLTIIVLGFLSAGAGWIGLELREHNDWLKALNNNQVKILHELKFDDP